MGQKQSKIGGLTWGDINWERGSPTVRAKKTEHHGGDHVVRIVPIHAELWALVVDAFAQAESGAVQLIPMASRKDGNLRTHPERIIAEAGRGVWPKLVQRLQASCATDWGEW